MSSATILSVDNLHLSNQRGTLFERVSFAVDAGESLAVMGPSGIGKSMLTKAVAGFLPSDMQASGAILLQGDDGLDADVIDQALIVREPSLRPTVIFQDALSALNPLVSVGRQLALAMGLNGKKLQGESLTKACKQLRELGFDAPEQTLTKYPSQLSGGQRQRICIAMALLGQAKLLIADEPTSALDPITERDILSLFLNSVKQRSIAGLLITHDIHAAMQCDKLLIIDGGEMVAYGEPKAALAASNNLYCRELHQLHRAAH